MGKLLIYMFLCGLFLGYMNNTNSKLCGSPQEIKSGDIQAVLSIPILLGVVLIRDKHKPFPLTCDDGTIIDRGEPK